ncbi:MAG: Glycine cleavage system H protein [Chloroflexi bacterium ADurb.Bin325]|nr:MAG: Glycine cleavage system H protein [Chloroflexi bacterium ADurb.Bin325]
MTEIRGFYFPDELYYLVEKHVWVQPIADGLARLGLTAVAYALLRRSLVAISVRPRVLGQEVARGRSVAMVESLKYNGPVLAPFDGVVVRANEQVAESPELAEADPYGSWIVEMRPRAWDPTAAGLLTGAAAMAAYRALLEAQNITPE